ncbi:hypothetical protein C9I57_28570 [Trinickia symbiotica]|uniref:Toxin SymE-like domain-containing protein n=1 Tax=Trinickia symbiotica TaxID=863227 RepID=A0A2T3XLB5_9BURK|nr:SymE family type I addiction module toxin [Trinickia symbiotica]PTB17316.1 hypothetical protein C9I57_28570 [Trinickia symbiotica]
MAEANHKSRSLVSERFVTVQESRRYQSSWNKPPYRYPAPVFYPWLKLAGRWIEHAGFRPGQRVKIAVEVGRLIITAA